MPSFELNKNLVQLAERYGFDFALSMIKLHGFGGETEFWDYGLESFSLMAALAAVTSKIKLFASTAVLTLPPGDGGAHGHDAKYAQMGLWPGGDFSVTVTIIPPNM